MNRETADEIVYIHTGTSITDSYEGSSCFSSVGVNLDVLVKGHTATGRDGSILPTPSAEEIMRKIAARYTEVSPLENVEDFHNFLSYLKEFRMTIGPVGVSSLRITVSCTRLEDLEELWRAYTTGALNEAAEKYLVTDAVLMQYNLKELRLTTFIDEEEYRKCKEQLAKREGTVTIGATFSQKNILYFVVASQRAEQQFIFLTQEKYRFAWLRPSVIGPHCLARLQLIVLCGTWLHQNSWLRSV